MQCTFYTYTFLCLHMWSRTVRKFMNLRYDLLPLIHHGGIRDLHRWLLLLLPYFFVPWTSVGTGFRAKIQNKKRIRFTSFFSILIFTRTSHERYFLVYQLHDSIPWVHKPTSRSRLHKSRVAWVALAIIFCWRLRAKI